MFLKKLIISDESGKTYREISFRKGMNIILGRSHDSSDSTNSLGKTTVLRAIDFCFGGKIELFYQDTENKENFNNTVKAFFDTKRPKFTLSLSSTFESTDELVIERIVDLSARKNKITNFIDSNKIDDKDFSDELKKRIFNLSDEKPTLRNLTPKFIRINDEQISQILKFNNKFTTDIDYEKIHLFLFGFDKTELLSNKSEIEHQLRIKRNDLNVLEKGKSISQIEQTLNLLRKDKEELERQRTNYEIDETGVDQDSYKLGEAQNNIDQTMKAISELNLKKHVSEQRLYRIQNERVNDSSGELNSLYEEASYYNPTLATQFDDLVRFHNQMLQGELGYLQEKIAEYKINLKDMEINKSNAINIYNQTLAKLGSKGSLIEYTRLSRRIEDLSENIGRNDVWLTDLQNAINKVNELEKKYNTLEDSLSELSTVDEYLKKFNELFSKYSEQLYGEKYLVSHSKRRNKSGDTFIKFKIDDIQGNVGSGEKQGVVAAFDLAYIAFTNHYNLYRPKFAMQDKAELIDIEKWKLLFNLANEQNGQFIAPFLYDKLANDYEEISEFVVLELSPNNKFFGIS